MPPRCLLYYITDRNGFPGDEESRRRRLLEKVAEAAQAGVDYIQLRERDLSPRDLETLAREAVRTMRERRLQNQELRPALLINSRTDVALAVGADGVHLRSDDIAPQEVRKIWSQCGAGAPARELSPRDPVIGVSCHSVPEVTQAAAASFAVFAPVFEKKDAPAKQSTGVGQLREACKAAIPVLALGGLTLENAKSCLEAGAAGIAAIRLFQENYIPDVVEHLRLTAQKKSNR